MRTGSRRVTGTLLASGFLAGWVTAVWVSPPPVVTQTAPPRPAPAAPAIDVPRVSLDRVAVPGTRPDGRRNPFAFRDGEAGPRVAATAAAAASPAPTAAPAAETDLFPWRLVGMATSDDGTATAVVSGLGDVHLVRVGDRLPDDSAVTAIDGRLVTVRLASGESRVLELP
jgi:hypothetical protein